MPRLELKIPPLLLAVLVALLMWLLATYLPVIMVNRLLAGIAAGCLGLGGIICVFLGVMQFRTSRTTVNPMRPEQASTLVTGGIYERTRNPMYVGMLLLLLGWAAWLGSAYALALPVLFVLYMNRFQIVPEETALQARFGDAFLAYCERVRRWL